MLLRFLLIITVIINYNSYAQDDRRDFDTELNYQSGAINKVKKEIEETRRKIKSEKKREKSTSRRLSNIDKEISLTNKLFNQLRNELNKTEIEIDNISKGIQANERQLSKLRKRYSAITPRAKNTHPNPNAIAQTIVGTPGTGVPK